MSNQPTTKDINHLQDVAFQMGVETQMVTVQNDLRLPVIVNAMTQVYLEQIDENKATDKQIKFKEYLETVSNLCVKSRQSMTALWEKLMVKSSEEVRLDMAMIKIREMQIKIQKQKKELETINEKHRQELERKEEQIKKLMES